MDVFSRLKSTVSQAVSQVASSLPGNPLTRDYDNLDHIASAGPGLLWKVYSAVKRSNGEPASLFVLEKRQLERWARGDRDALLTALRQAVARLTRLRHPLVLTVQQPLEESRDSLAFATEPVFASLANVLGQLDNTPSPAPRLLAEYKFEDLDIKYGLYQLGRCLAFLHGSDVGVLHRSVCPASVMIDRSGAWKLFGFEVSVASDWPPQQQMSWSAPDYQASVHPMCQPPLAFSAPELSQCRAPITAAVDVFSLACLVHAVFVNDSGGGGRPLFDCNADWDAFTRAMTQLKRAAVSEARVRYVPVPLRSTVLLMLNYDPLQRPDALQFTQAAYFDDVGVKTLNYLDSLFQWDNLQKSQFYKGLPHVLSRLPLRVCLHRVVPALAREFVNPVMVPFVLPSVMAVTESCSHEQFVHLVWPRLEPVLTITEPIQVLYVLIKHMQLLMSKARADATQDYLVPLLHRAMLPDVSVQLQHLSLETVPRLVSHLSSSCIGERLVPPVKHLCLSTNQLSVRVGCLVCMGRLLSHLDKWLVIDHVLPLLPQIPSREPAVVMATLGIYKLVMNSDRLGMSKELMATQVVPFLMPLTVEKTLSPSQFDVLMRLLKDMIDRVEAEQRDKLTQLAAVSDQQRQVHASTLAHASGAELTSMSATASYSISSDVNQMFRDLGIDTACATGVKEASPSAISPTVSGITLNRRSTTTSVVAAGQASSMTGASATDAVIGRNLQQMTADVAPATSVSLSPVSVNFPPSSNFPSASCNFLPASGCSSLAAPVNQTSASSGFTAAPGSLSQSSVGLLRCGQFPPALVTTAGSVLIPTRLASASAVVAQTKPLSRGEIDDFLS